jgi:hypothetical protein
MLGELTNFTTMKQNQIIIPQAALLPAQTMFHQENESINQLIYFDRSLPSAAELQLPYGKALRASVTYLKDPSDFSGNTIAQQVNIYRSGGKKYSESIYDTRHAHVRVSQTKVTVSMSFTLSDNPERLKAQLQNFANIVIDETDEIAAMLSQQGAEKVQEAWKTLAEENAETINS